MPKATELPQKFLKEFAKTANAAESYMKAYPTAKKNSAYSNANRLLRNDAIQARLAELTAEMRSEKIASAAEMQEILTRIARQEQEEEVVVVEGVEKGVSEARIIKKRPSNQDAIKAISQLARMQGVDNGGAVVNVVIPVIGGDEQLED